MGTRKAAALLEFRGILKGVSAVDAMVKTAAVEPVVASPLCPGRYMVLIKGGVSEISAVLEMVHRDYSGAVYDSFETGNLSDGVFAALSGLGYRPTAGDALGFIETSTASAAVLVADTCVKAAEAALVDIRLAQGLGGRSYVITAGCLDAVGEAVFCGSKAAASSGALIGSIVLPSPHQDLYATL